MLYFLLCGLQRKNEEATLIKIRDNDLTLTTWFITKYELYCVMGMNYTVKTDMSVTFVLCISLPKIYILQLENVENFVKYVSVLIILCM